MTTDAKDKAILYYLDEDAFQPLSSLARQTKLSKQVVAYRLAELEKKGILRKTSAIVNLATLGYVFYKFYIKYKVMTKEEEAAMLKTFDRHPRVGYMCICDGPFDLFVGVWAKGTHDLYALNRELFTNYKPHFEEIVVSMVEVAFNSKRGYLVSQEKKTRAPLFGGAVREVSLDETDHRILRLLSENARMKHTEIARHVALTPAAVGYRIKHLQKNGVIEGARTVLDKSKLGYLAFKVLVKTGSVEERRIQQFIRHATQERNIVDIDLTLGAWDVELDVEIETHERFHALLLELRSAFPDLIQSYETLLVFKEYTYDYFPIGKKFHPLPVARMPP